MRTKTKTTTIIVTCIQHEQDKLKRVGYLTVNEACNYIFSGHTNFTTQTANVSKARRYIRKHAPQCIKQPSATYVNAYRRNHVDVNNPQGQLPEGNYQITPDVIEAMKAKFI